MYHIECRDKNGEGGTYHARTYTEVVKLFTKLLEWGRKWQGEPFTEIHVTSGHKETRRTAKATQP